MYKQLLLEMLAQNQMTCSFTFDNITHENSRHRLTKEAASVGFIYRHMGETMNLFGTFFGIPTHVQNTTMRQQDVGQHYDLDSSHRLVVEGYKMLEDYVVGASDASWLEVIETPFFGTVSRIRLFSHILFHNSHHAGQISLTLARSDVQA